MKRLFVACLLALTLSAVSADAADVTTGHSGWSWGNPQPQGNTLRAVEFAGTRGFAAGDFGTLLRTDDRGRNWTGAFTGTTASIDHISIADQNTVVAGSGCVVLRSEDAGISFKALAPACDSPIESLSFPSAQTGYLLRANGSVLKTSDGGATFDFAGPVTQTATGGAADIFFTDDNTGFAVTGDAVYRTSDGGNTWFQRTTSTQALHGVYFPSPSVGYAVGASNTVLKTTDGGETWDAKPVADTVPSSELMSIRCATNSSCVIATESGERVLRTGNGGNSYTAFSPAAQKIFALSFSNDDTAVAVGEHGTTVLSTNADMGTPSFVPVADQPLADSFNRLRSGTGTLVLAPGDGGKLASSTDGGRHWSSVQVPTSADLRDAWFVDPNVGFVLDAAGKVQRTTDGGDGWGELPTGTTAKPNALYAPDQSTVLLFGPKGVRRATSGTDPKFDLVESKAAATTTLFDYDRTDGLALFAYGPRKLIVSSDLGASWTKVNGPVKKPDYRRVDFLTGNLGFALLESHRLFWTRNGGKSWSELVGTGSGRGYDISFADSRNGFLAVDRHLGSARSGWVLRTDDGGSTWRPQLISPTPLATGGLVATDPATAFGLAGVSDLFYTGTGGDQSSITSALTIKPKLRTIHRSRRVKITGKLAPAVEGATVVVQAYNPKTRKWTAIGKPAVSATGSFTVSMKVRHTTPLVAQWAGSAAVRGDGSPVVTIVKKRR